MSLFENNLPRDDRANGADTSLIRSLYELNAPLGEGPALAARRALRCDAFRVEYTTVPGEKGALVRDVAIIPSVPSGFPEGSYTLMPQPHGGLMEDLAATLLQAERADMLGSSLLSELQKIQGRYPGYRWMPSHGEPTEADLEVPLATPILFDFATFVEYPRWTPRYEMKETRGAHTHRAVAFFRDGIVWCFFSSVSSTDVTDRFVGKIRLRYAGPELTAEEHPSMVGERIMAGIVHIMAVAKLEGSLHALEALVRRDLKPAFLEPIQEVAAPLLGASRGALLDPAPRTLPSGGLAQWSIGKEMKVASLVIRANNKPESANLTIGFLYGHALEPNEYLGEVATAYLDFASKSESQRLFGLRKMRELEPNMTYVGASLPHILGVEGSNKLAELAKKFDIKRQTLSGSNLSIANISALCDGIEEVELGLGSVPRARGLYRYLTLGWAPDGALHFSARSGVGGMLEGVLSSSMLKAQGGRTAAALSLVESFGQQQEKDRMWFERRIQEKIAKDNNGTSFALSEGNGAYCAMPPSDDQEGQAAYNLGASLVYTFEFLSKIPGRSSVHYCAPATCEVLFGYAGAPFDMVAVFSGTTLKSVRISPALPSYFDPVKRLPPLFEVQTERPIVESKHGAHGMEDLLSAYLTLARESSDPRIAKPLIESTLYKTLRALEVQPQHAPA